jgi:hypothetical protein
MVPTDKNDAFEADLTVFVQWELSAICQGIN